MIHDSVENASQSQCGTSHAQDNQQKLVQEALSKIKHKFLVMSGKGGVGKSSIAANIAMLLAQKGFKVGLMDVDVHGPSIAQIMGLKGLLDITQDKRLIPVSIGDNLKVISMQSLMQEDDQAVIWRGPVKAGRWYRAPRPRKQIPQWGSRSGPGSRSACFPGSGLPWRSVR